MKINARGLVLLKDYEGCKLKAYKDSVNVWTVGFGHTGPDTGPGLVIDQAKADSLLLQDLEKFEKGIQSLLHVGLSPDGFSALVILAFNIGLGNFGKSTLLKLVNQGDFQAAAQEFIKWNKAGGLALPGLTRRRLAEKELFLSQPVGTFGPAF